MVQLFTAGDIKNYAYCPVIIYITHTLGIREVETEYMAYGREKEVENTIIAAIKLTNAVEVKRRVNVKSKTLGLSGIVDYVLVTKTGELIPLDIKWSEAPKSPKTNHVLQLAAYALMLEESLGAPVKMGLLYYITSKGGRIYRIFITSELKRRLENTIKDMVNIIKKGPINIKINKKKCISCNYKPYCPITSPNH